MKKALVSHLGRGVRGLDSRERTLLFVPFTRFRDVSRDLAPPMPALLGDRSLYARRKKTQKTLKNYKWASTDGLAVLELTDRSTDYV